MSVSDSYCEANAAAGAAQDACARWVDFGLSHSWGQDLGTMAGPPPLLAPVVLALVLLIVVVLAVGVARGSARRRAMNETAPAGEQSPSTTTPAGGAR